MSERGENNAPAAAREEAAEGRPDSNEALELLKQGNARHQADTPQRRPPGQDRARRIAAQQPLALVICCADSRVEPQRIFDTGPGELFVVRVAGNLVGDHAQASAQYAVELLKVPLAVVLGHSGCGAVEAAISCERGERGPAGKLGSLLAEIGPAVRATRWPEEEWESRAINENVATGIRRLQDLPSLGAAESRGELRVLGGVYDLESGAVVALTLGGQNEAKRT